MTDLADRAYILQQLDGEWQKIAVALVYMFSRGAPVLITHKVLEELNEFMATHKLLTWGHQDSIELRLVTPERAKEIAAHVESMGGRADRPS